MVVVGIQERKLKKRAGRVRISRPLMVTAISNEASASGKAAAEGPSSHRFKRFSATSNKEARALDTLQSQILVIAHMAQPAMTNVQVAADGSLPKYQKPEGWFLGGF